jgi:hypothetical protein
MNHFDAVSTLFVFGFAILFLAGGVVLLLFRGKRTSLTTVDKLFIAGWWLIFAWPLDGVSLMILTHQIYSSFLAAWRSSWEWSVRDCDHTLAGLSFVQGQPRCSK